MSTEAIVAALLAFVGGAVYEFGCVFWIHNAGRDRPGRTAAWSMICAACELTGIVGSVKHTLAIPAFILGYGCGSYLGVSLLKSRAPRG